MNIRLLRPSRIRKPIRHLSYQLSAAPTAIAKRSKNRLRDDRGDVPGWVMITMMTAIVVIVLLGVFQEAVVNAVQNAFDSITG